MVEIELRYDNFGKEDLTNRSVLWKSLRNWWKLLRRNPPNYIEVLGRLK